MSQHLIISDFRVGGALGRHYVQIRSSILHSYELHQSLRVLDSFVWSLPGNYLMQDDSEREYVCFDSVDLVVEYLGCHPMLNKTFLTKVPRIPVINDIETSLDSPKSAILRWILSVGCWYG